MAPNDKAAKYVYGVVRAKSGSRPRSKGINGKPVRVVAATGLGALTSKRCPEHTDAARDVQRGDEARVQGTDAQRDLHLGRYEQTCQSNAQTLNGREPEVGADPPWHRRQPTIGRERVCNGCSASRC